MKWSIIFKVARLSRITKSFSTTSYTTQPFRPPNSYYKLQFEYLNILKILIKCLIYVKNVKLIYDIYCA